MKVKVTISREDGKPITTGVTEPCPAFLTDISPIMVIRKDGGTVEALCGDIFTLLEFTVRQLEGLAAKERRELCEAFGLELKHD